MPGANAEPERGHGTQELRDWLSVSLTTGLGPVYFRQLLSAFGPPDKILGASHAGLARVVPPTVCRGWTRRAHTSSPRSLPRWMTRFCTTSGRTLPGGGRTPWWG